MVQVVSLPAQMEHCVENCQDCHRMCSETVTHCLEMGGQHAEPSHIRLLLDCAQICHTSADFMIRTSDLHGEVCGVCASICERGAHECERFSEDFMRICAELCLRCAESCRMMARMG